jgi:hypothetical protein
MSKRYARPKGKKFFPISITLTQEQIAYLNAQPNASEVIRKILDDLIQVRKDVEANLGAVVLKNQLEVLDEEERRLVNARRESARNNEYLWKTCESWESGIPEPKDSSSLDAQVALKVLKEYDKALASIRQRIQEIKKRIIESE